MCDIEYRHQDVRYKGCRQPLHRVDLCLEGETAGTAYFRIYHRPTLIYYLPQVIIAPELQNQGLGQRLMLECSRWLDELNVPSLTLNIHGERGSKKLYEENGWERVRDGSYWFAFNAALLRCPVDQAIGHISR